MSFPKLIAGALLAGSLAVGGVALAGSNGFDWQSGARQLASQDEEDYGQAANGKTLSMAEIVERLSAEGYGEVREIERKGTAFEVKARASDGRWKELYLDGATGKVLKVEDDD